MLNLLFRTLTADPDAGAALFGALTAAAREPAWYREAGVPDTIDGRFAVLATLTAMALVRLEQEGAAGNAASVALTERFVAVMETEHRELGLGDPKLGRTVRKLVGSLSRRTDLCRTAAERGDWQQAARDALYKGEAAPAAFDRAAAALRQFWERLQRTGPEALSEGEIA
jgi:cytochrome b pre-mRNA-processing protein 3